MTSLSFIFHFMRGKLDENLWEPEEYKIRIKMAEYLRIFLENQLSIFLKCKFGDNGALTITPIIQIFEERWDIERMERFEEQPYSKGQPIDREKQFTKVLRSLVKYLDKGYPYIYAGCPADVREDVIPFILEHAEEIEEGLFPAFLDFLETLNAPEPVYAPPVETSGVSEAVNLVIRAPQATFVYVATPSTQAESVLPPPSIATST